MKEIPNIPFIIFKAVSKNVIPAKAGIQNLLISLDSRLRGSDKLIIIRGSHMYLVSSAVKAQNRR